MDIDTIAEDETRGSNRREQLFSSASIDSWDAGQIANGNTSNFKPSSSSSTFTTLHVTTPPRRRNSIVGSPGHELHSPSSRYAAPSSSSGAVNSNLPNNSSSSTNNNSSSSTNINSSSSSSSSTNQTIYYSDRHIPSRITSKLDDFDSMEEGGGGSGGGGGGMGSQKHQPQPQSDVARENQGIMNSLLRAELLGHSLIYSPRSFEPVESDRPVLGSPTPSSNVFRYSQTVQAPAQPLSLSLASLVSSDSSTDSSFGPGSPGATSRLSLSPRKPVRRIPKAPYKVLDAPMLQDDYYLNLLDWSAGNILSVALGPSVYMWSACTAKVTKLCELPPSESVSSICFCPDGSQLAVGTSAGKVQIWDIARADKLQELWHHSSRVGTMAWSSTLLATGSRDRSVLLQDPRARSSADSSWQAGSSVGANASAPSVVRELLSHRQEVCGLKWSPDEKMLASGGNDNKLFVWALNHGDASSPLCRFSDHAAAVKAVAWSPHQHGLLASGGGTADRNIRFWNTLSGVALHRVDTGSQVCNLVWARNCNEIVSTHGYSQNQVIVWKYPSMQKQVTLTGHTTRVLYLAMSPDGQSVVTGAGDETLRFWSVFPGPRNAQSRAMGLLLPGSDIR